MPVSYQLPTRIGCNEYIRVGIYKAVPVVCLLVRSSGGLIMGDNTKDNHSEMGRQKPQPYLRVGVELDHLQLVIICWVEIAVKSKIAALFFNT